MTKLVFTCIFFVLCVTISSAQGKTFKAGIEMQAYPTGLISGVRGDLYLSNAAKLHMRIGYNHVRHGDAGVHDDERGGGMGFTLGYDILPLANHRWTIGLRSDLWWNTLDWYDDIPGQQRATGTSRITVLQPTVQAGYRMPIGERIEILPTLSFGYEINVRTVGAEVGHGAILLLGIVANYELSSAR